MADTAMRLCGPAALTTSAVTVYTVPALTTTIVRSIHVTNTNASTAYTFTMSVGADAAGTRLFSAITVPPAGTLDWSGFLVLNAADIVQALASNAALTLTVSGIEVA